MRDLFDRLRSVVIWIFALPFFLAACMVVWLGSFVLRLHPGSDGRARHGMRVGVDDASLERETALERE